MPRDSPTPPGWARSGCAARGPIHAPRPPGRRRCPSNPLATRADVPFRPRRRPFDQHIRERLGGLLEPDHVAFGVGDRSDQFAAADVVNVAVRGRARRQERLQRLVNVLDAPVPDGSVTVTVRMAMLDLALN
jgi:hypothetical protein